MMQNIEGTPLYLETKEFRGFLHGFHQRCVNAAFANRVVPQVFLQYNRQMSRGQGFGALHRHHSGLVVGAVTKGVICHQL